MNKTQLAVVSLLVFNVVICQKLTISRLKCLETCPKGDQHVKVGYYVQWGKNKLVLD